MERLTEQLRWWAAECDRTNFGCQARKLLLEAADRLAYYEDLEEQGRLVVLPCKVGDTVYQLTNKRHARGTGIAPRIVSSACVWSNREYALTHQGMTYCQSRDLGKTWFLTREEAEAALQKEGEHG